MAVAPPPSPTPGKRYAVKAEHSRQMRLLDLQGVDTRLDQLAHKRAHLPVRAQLADLTAKAAAAKDHLVRAQTAQSDVKREVAKADGDVQLVRDRAARDQARLDAGTGTAKDLQAITHELTSLARRQAELEDIEIEVMERADRADEIVAAANAAVADLDAQVAAASAEHDEALGDLDAQIASVGAPRVGLTDEVGADLLALYEKLRASHNGVGAAALHQRRCLGCQLQLNAADLEEIRAAAADEVIRCEECGRILVRIPESGL